MKEQLVEASKHQLWLHTPISDKEGAPLRIEHFRSIKRQTGQVPEELDGPNFPSIARYLWDWFCELHSGRSSGPLSFSEIKAWSELTQRPVRPWEIDAIKQIDSYFMELQQNRMRKNIDSAKNQGI